MCEQVALQLLYLLYVVVELRQRARRQNVRDILGKQLRPQLDIVWHINTHRFAILELETQEVISTCVRTVAATLTSDLKVNEF